MLWLLASVWGGSYLLIKYGLESYEPVFVVWARLALGALVLYALAKQRDAIAPLRAKLAPLAILAATQVAVPFLLLTYGEEHIPSSLTGILVAATPIFTAGLMFAGFGSEDRLSGWTLGGIGLGMVGIVLLFGVDLTGSSDELLGGLMVVGCAFGYAVGALYMRRHLVGVPAVGVAFGTMGFSALMTLPLALFALPDDTTVRSAASVAVLGLVGTGVAFWVFYWLIGTVGAARAAMVTYIAPGFALFYGAVFRSEPVTVGAIGGLALILSGCYMAAEGRAPWQRKTVPIPV